MPASVHRAAPIRGLPALRRLAVAAVVGALLLQALLAVPLAVRMAADAMQWLDLGAAVCAHADDGTPSADPRPFGHQPAHDHGQCQICQGAMLPLGLLAAGLSLLALLFAPAPIRALATAGPFRWRWRFGSYLSRAPPALA